MGIDMPGICAKGRRAGSDARENEVQETDGWGVHMLGVALVLAAAVLYGIEPSFKALALESGITPVEIMKLSSFVIFAVSAGGCMAKRENLYIKRKEILEYLATGAAGMGATNLLLIIAYKYIPVGCATVIHFMYPSLVCVSMVIFFHSPLTWKKVLAIFLSAAGVALISGEGFDGSFKGFLAAMLSGITYSFYTLMVEKGGRGPRNLKVRMFYMTLGCFLFSFALELFSESWGNWNAFNMGIVLICSLMGCAAAFFYAVSVKLIGASNAAFFSIFEPVTSMVFSTMVYHDSFSEKAVLGCVLAVLSILAVWRDGCGQLGNEKNPLP